MQSNQFERAGLTNQRFGLPFATCKMIYWTRGTNIPRFRPPFATCNLINWARGTNKSKVWTSIRNLQSNQTEPIESHAIGYQILAIGQRGLIYSSCWMSSGIQTFRILSVLALQARLLQLGNLIVIYHKMRWIVTWSISRQGGHHPISWDVSAIIACPRPRMQKSAKVLHSLAHANGRRGKVSQFFAHANGRRRVSRYCEGAS